MPGGRLRTAGLRNRRDLRDRSLDVGSGAKENLDDSQSVDRLGFHMLDVVDGGGDAALGIDDDPVRHVLRRHPRIKPDHRYDGNIDVGKDINWSAKSGDDKKNDDDERHHHERIRTS